MAKLSAHGTEILRYSLKRVEPENETTEWSRKSYAIMSDGKLLTKLDVRFKAAQYSPAHNHSYGWKLAGNVKKDLDLNAHKAKLLEKGFEIEVDNLPA